MKILMIVPYFYPHVGGVEGHVLNLSKELLNRGISVVVVTPKYDLGLRNEEEISGIKVLRYPKINIPKLGQLFFLLWLTINKNKIGTPDIIHGHDLYSRPARWVFPDISYFITFHGYEGYPLQEGNVRIRQWVNRQVKGSIAVGDFIVKWYRTKVDRVSYGAVNLPSDEENKKIIYDGCFVGRLESDTGIETYLKALLTLKGQGVNFKLIVCGDGSLRKKLETYAKRKELDVEFVGMITNVGQYLEKSRMAFVSGYLSILEAAIRKKIVISTYDNPLKKDYLTMIPNSSEIMMISYSTEKIAKAIL